MAIQSISSTDASWYTKLNANFAELLESPYPVKTYADVPTLTSAKNPKLYRNCFAVVSGIIYTSDGTDWVIYREQLTYIADLDTGTATITDIKNAFNSLLADLRTKQWITT